MAIARAAALNRETPAAALRAGLLTPNAEFYLRNHFAVPELDIARWRLQVGGLVHRPRGFGLPDLLRLPAHSATVTLECAGNGRSLLSPPVGGEQWGLRAVGNATWTGVLLADVLERAGLLPDAREILFRGADGFERSLGLEAVRGSEILLAHAMNDQPLPALHGCPLRVIVPGWYAVADVKWLTGIEVLGQAFSGTFQTQKYVYEREVRGQLVREPVRLQRVRALITEPASEKVARRGDLAVRGLAWSGAAPIARVEVSLNGGGWQRARLLGAGDRYSWRRWELVLPLDRPGRTSIRARATDSAGHTQPEQAEWNRLGYGNNAVQEVAILVA